MSKYHCVLKAWPSYGEEFKGNKNSNDSRGQFVQTARIFLLVNLLSAVQIYTSYIHIRFIHHSRVDYELTIWPAPSWFDSSVGRALHPHRRGHGFESRSTLIFLRLSFRNCLSCVQTARIFLLLNLKCKCKQTSSNAAGMRERKHFWIVYSQRLKPGPVKVVVSIVTHLKGAVSP